MTPQPTRWQPALAAILLAGIVLTGCSGDSDDSKPQNSKAAPSESDGAAKHHPVTGDVLAENQVFTYRIANEPSSLDPHWVEDFDGAYIARDLFEGLLNSDASGDPIPGVAERFEVADEYRTWIFHLRDDARWSDGRNVTAGDFVYAWRRAVDPAVAAPHAWYLTLMSVANSQAVINGELATSELGIEALDEHTLRVRLTQPRPYLDRMVTHPITFALPQWAIDQHGEQWTQPEHLVGNGAFTLEEHTVNERLIRVRNERYWNKDTTFLNRVVTLVEADESRALSRYDAGELDMTDVPADAYPRLRRERPEETHAVPQLCTYFYTFNTDVEPFDDARVRRALAYAIDRDAIVGDILKGGQQPAFTLTPPVTASFTPPDTEFRQMEQAEREAQARELMAQAGFDDDTRLATRIAYNTALPHEDIALAIAAMWRDTLGVDVTLQSQDWPTLQASRRDGRFDIARGGWCGDYNEPSAFLNLLHSQSDYNDGDYESPAYDRRLEEARTMMASSEQYAQLERIVTEDMPIAPVYHYAGTMMLKPHIKGWPLGELHRNAYSREMYVTEHRNSDSD